MATNNKYFSPLFVLLVSFVSFGIHAVSAKDRYYDFEIKETSYTRLCQTKKIITVNGQFPGPTIQARRGDTVVVKVRNSAEYNITIHWHGIDQLRNPWVDGPEYITQCPIQPGSSFTYKFHIASEIGTVWWHAHSSWDRATVHGQIIIRPRRGIRLAFPKPHGEIPIVLGEWWVGNITQNIGDALRTGGLTNDSDAYTINGQPGDLYPCSKQGTFKAVVEHGKKYLLRVLNAGLSSEHFFAVAGHKLTVVGKDAAYTKPLTVDYIMITPGQTYDLLLEANQTVGSYYIAARPYSSAEGVSVDNTTTTGILEYRSSKPSTTAPLFPYLPELSDNDAATSFVAGLRSLASKRYPVDVPQTIDERVVIAVSMNVILCSPKSNCVGFNGTRYGASLNNISFVSPSMAILPAYFQEISSVYGTKFPSEPLFPYNYTSDNNPPFLFFTEKGTQVKVFEYGKSVEVVFQGTSLLAGENHPIHLHGRSFYVVGRGFGNFDKEKDPLSYNLVDPPFENTVGVPKDGWAAIRFRTLNPGVWFLHCHLERHMSWGMAGVFIVKDGADPDTKMLPQPPNMPPC